MIWGSNLYFCNFRDQTVSFAPIPPLGLLIAKRNLGFSCVEGYGKKPLILSYRKQAQDMVNLLL